MKVANCWVWSLNLRFLAQVTIRFDDGTVVSCQGNAINEYADELAIMPLEEADDLFLDEDHYHLHLGTFLQECSCVVVACPVRRNAEGLMKLGGLYSPVLLAGFSVCSDRGCRI